MKATLALLLTFCLALVTSVASAFEIELPKHYREDLEAKRDREGAVLWRELDRKTVEATIREFVAAHHQIDGVDLVDVGELHWSRGGRVMSLGPWSVFLAEWELSFPPLKRITWSRAKLVVSLAYDLKSKVVKRDGNGEIRLSFDLARRGPIFAKKVITPHFDGFDYGEVYLVLPFGGVELRKANQTPEPTTALVTPRADARVAPSAVVAHL